MNRQYEDLKEMEVRLSPGFPPSLTTRTHRALSWLQRAEQEETDDDARFIFLWICLNSLYGREIPERRETRERQIYRHFLGRLIKCDSSQLLQKLLSHQYEESVTNLIDNQYVFQPFWEYKAGRIGESEWKKRFAADRSSAHVGLKKGITYKGLEVILDRLYVLRNQVIHGNSTWKSSQNRSQVTNGAKVLDLLVPAFIHIVLCNPSEDWGQPSFPVVD